MKKVVLFLVGLAFPFIVAFFYYIWTENAYSLLQVHKENREPPYLFYFQPITNLSNVQERTGIDAGEVSRQMNKINDEQKDSDASPDEKYTDNENLDDIEIIENKANEEKTKEDDRTEQNDEFSEEMTDTEMQKERDAELILITNATMVQPTADWMPTGEEAFMDCPNLESWMKCEYYPPSSGRWNESHAVLFHARHLENESYIPTFRPPGQKWIFYETEPPPKTWDRVKYDMNVWKQFNFTVSYTSDADMTHNFYRLRCDLKDNWQPRGVNFAENKTMVAAWLVSNCVSDSQREVYVGELMKYIPVDKYGACGMDSHCDPYPGGVNCINKLLEDNYKFYLSFENGFCSEYYTEKIGKVIPLKVVPVVLGYTNYSALLPRGSYIDVRDFNSIRELAKYLQYLMRNDTAYNAYIEKKSQVQCEQDDKISLPCKLCKYLHDHRQETQLAGDPRVFWGVKERCRSPKQFYQDCAPEIVDKVKTPRGFKIVGIV